MLDVIEGEWFDVRRTYAGRLGRARALAIAALTIIAVAAMARG